MRLLILCCMLIAGPAFAEADGPDAWRVTNVANDDQLNFRAGPSTEYLVLGRLPHDGRGLQADICVPTLSFQQYDQLSTAEQDAIANLPRWCLVRQDQAALGWVNAYYLAEDAQ